MLAAITLPHRARCVNRMMVRPPPTPYVQPMTPAKHDHNEAGRQQALADLERLRHQDETLSGSLAAWARRTAEHFAGRDGEAVDAIEVWGKRIGRALSLAGVLVLAAYLYATYLR